MSDLRERVARAMHEMPWDETAPVDAKDRIVLQDLALSHADAAIALVLEEAAKVADEDFNKHVDMAIYGHPENARAREAMANMAERIAIAIRNLAE